MVDCNSTEAPNAYPNLNDQQFRLNKTNEVKDYFIAKIKERELMCKRIRKYSASFDYFDKLYLFYLQQMVEFVLHHLLLLLEHL